MVRFELNGKYVESSAESDTPLLWVIRDELGLKGTKFGCGIAMCGACTVHIDGNPVRSCSFPVAGAAGTKVTTIEGLNDEHPLQHAWVEEQVPQCGYCQSGQIMQAATLLERNADPSEKEIVDHMSANLCRCMAYPRIKKAIQRAATVTATARKES
ncbi:MAG: (2Fe-2S)-binding protein [bacterium]|nr:(2Fe-2S)-binding protein [bacterium]